MANILVRDKQTLYEALDSIDPIQPVFSDTETYTREGKTSGGLYGNIRLFQMFQNHMDQAYLLDCMFVDLHTILEVMKRCHLVFHNASYDLHTINMHTEDCWLPKKISDTLYMSRVALYHRGPRFDFYNALRHARLFSPELTGIDKSEHQKADWGGPLTSSMIQYAEFDVTYLAKLYDIVIAAEDTEVYKLDIFNLEFAIEYARRGIPTNQNEVKRRLGESLEKMEDLLKILPVNPNSPKQCCQLLGTKASDMDTLVHLALKGNKDAKNIRDARQISKTITFLKKYNRPLIKGFYNACGAISGRMSCTGGDSYDHDNLQQIPRRILDCLEAPDGYVFVYKDYAGLELRMAVCWIAEPTMLELILNDVDLHTHTGCRLFGVTIQELTDFQRMIGKICNFLLIYGGQVKILQATIRAWGGILMEFKECKVLRDRWLSEYGYFDVWHEMNKSHLQVYGYKDVKTALGRPVRTYQLNDALNVPIQGSSSEVTKTSLAMLKTRYPKENLISTIHDSNTLLVREEDAETWVNNLNECMIDAWAYVIKDLPVNDLPMPAEAKFNKKWDF